MVETADTSCIARLGWADMRLPLVYSISWPHRLRMPYKPLDPAELSQLTFMKPDRKKYPCIDLAYSAGQTGGTMTAVLNAANEMAKMVGPCRTNPRSPGREPCRPPHRMVTRDGDVDGGEDGDVDGREDGDVDWEGDSGALQADRQV